MQSSIQNDKQAQHLEAISAQMRQLQDNLDSIANDDQQVIRRLRQAPDLFKLKLNEMLFNRSTYRTMEHKRWLTILWSLIKQVSELSL